MLTSYCDETGHADDPNKKHLGMAGLLAENDAWDAFDLNWRNILREEGVCSPFHMTDFAAQRGQFSDRYWKNEDRRQKLLGRLLDAIEKTNAMPIGAIVNVPDFRSLSVEYQQRLGHDKREPYYVAFQYVTRELALAAALAKWPPEKIAMVYAKLKKFTGVAEDWWSAMQTMTLLGNFMGTYTRGEPDDLSPLQASDIWAYELGHHFHWVLPNQRQWRYPFKRLVSMCLRTANGHRFFEYYDRKTLLAQLGEIE